MAADDDKKSTETSIVYYPFTDSFAKPFKTFSELQDDPALDDEYLRMPMKCVDEENLLTFKTDGTGALRVLLKVSTSSIRYIMINAELEKIHNKSKCRECKWRLATLVKTFSYNETTGKLVNVFFSTRDNIPDGYQALHKLIQEIENTGDAYIDNILVYSGDELYPPTTPNDYPHHHFKLPYQKPNWKIDYKKVFSHYFPVFRKFMDDYFTDAESFMISMEIALEELVKIPNTEHARNAVKWIMGAVRKDYNELSNLDKSLLAIKLMMTAPIYDNGIFWYSVVNGNVITAIAESKDKDDFRKIIAERFHPDNYMRKTAEASDNMIDRFRMEVMCEPTMSVGIVDVSDDRIIKLADTENNNSGKIEAASSNSSSNTNSSSSNKQSKLKTFAANNRNKPKTLRNLIDLGKVFYVRIESTVSLTFMARVHGLYPHAFVDDNVFLAYNNNRTRADFLGYFSNANLVHDNGNVYVPVVGFGKTHKTHGEYSRFVLIHNFVGSSKHYDSLKNLVSSLNLSLWQGLLKNASVYSRPFMNVGFTVPPLPSNPVLGLGLNTHDSNGKLVTPIHVKLTRNGKEISITDAY